MKTRSDKIQSQGPVQQVRSFTVVATKSSNTKLASLGQQSEAESNVFLIVLAATMTQLLSFDISPYASRAQ